MQMCEEQRVTVEDRRELEKEIKELEDRIGKYQLIGSKVTSPKEMKLVRELRKLRRMR